MLPKEETKYFYEIALTFVPEVGAKTARALLARYKTAEEIFSAPAKELKSVEGIGELRAKMFKNKDILTEAEKELRFIDKHNVQPLFLNDEKYPRRLLHCDDAPVLLYYKGNADLNAEKVVAVIGTRKNTDYGQRVTEDLIEGLRGINDLIVVSGLALGIDTIAHRASVKNEIQTVGVTGHGLDRIYPYANKSLANEMLQHGGLLTEFPSETKPDRQNFPVRNRIVAGISDITVIVESDEKGGAMITAYIAHSYQRDVAAIPGRIYDTKSSGPNLLIKRNIAAMISNAADLLDLMNWHKGNDAQAIQKQLFPELPADQQVIYDLLKEKDSLHSDVLLYQSGFSNSQLASILLQMEIQGIIKALPGKHYRLN